MRKDFIKLIECPRDAMQGIHDFIETETKIKYINQLLKVGFDTLDFGSFVSPKAIPQMADTALVMDSIVKGDKTKLLAIVANFRGALQACKFDQIDYLGYPFSISETFQIRNTNATIEESLERVKDIKDLCDDCGKDLVIYISMGFGNPYGDEWNHEIINHWVSKLAKLGISIFSMSDTIGVSNPDSISYIFETLIPQFPNIEFGAHLHTRADTWREKVEAAYQSGCFRFDGAIKGYGGCPMAKDELIGNMPMENLIYYFDDKNLVSNINKSAFIGGLGLASETFPL